MESRGDGEMAVACAACGGPVTIELADAGASAVRCDRCFDAYLHQVDLEFLRAYADLGCQSRRVVAEACLRALVMADPPQRKVLAMTVYEQFVAAAGDLVALYEAVRDQAERPILRTFLTHHLDGRRAREFASEVASLGEDGVLDILGLPRPGELTAAGWPVDRQQRRELADALRTVAVGLQTAARNGVLTTGAFLELAAGGGRAALVERTGWAHLRDLQPHQVATLALNARQRYLAVNTLEVDEGRLAEVAGAIDGFTRTAQDLVFAVLTVAGREGARRLVGPRTSSGG